MKGKEIEQNILTFHDLKKTARAIRKPVSRKKQHYPIPILVLIVLIYIFEVKKRCKKQMFE